MKFSEYILTEQIYFAQIDGITGEKLNASKLHSRIIQCAKILQLQYQVKEGDVIGIYSENRLEFPVIVYAAFCLGATVTPLNITYTPRELHHALSLSQPRVLFTTAFGYNKVVDVLPENLCIESVVLLDEQVVSDPKFVNLQHLTEKFPECDSFECTPVDMKENVALILCSSGTTGLPKGVELTQYNIITSISQSK